MSSGGCKVSSVRYQVVGCTDEEQDRVQGFDWNDAEHDRRQALRRPGGEREETEGRRGLQACRVNYDLVRLGEFQ